MLDDVKVSEQLLDLVFYMLIILGGFKQEFLASSHTALLHSALVTCSLYLLTACISSQWIELAQVLLAHPKVEIFMSVAFAAVRVDIQFLQIKLSDQCNYSYTRSSPSAEETLNHLSQHCEASLQFLQSLCQQKFFRECVVKNKVAGAQGKKNTGLNHPMKLLITTNEAIGVYHLSLLRLLLSFIICTRGLPGETYKQ